MLTIDSQYKQLIVGATFAGLGNLLCDPEDALLVESSTAVGWEFIEAFQPGEDWERTGGLDPLTEDLRRELVERNILDEARVHLPAIAPVLFRRLDRSGADYLFQTDILEVEPCADGYRVTLGTRSGVRRLDVERIVDTTTCFLSDPDREVTLERKGIGANLNLRRGETCKREPIHTRRYALIPGRFTREAFLTLSLPVETEWAGAREALHRFWLDRPEALSAWDLVAVGTRLAEKPVHAAPAAARWLHLPSALYPNPLRAFAAGVGVMEEGLKLEA